MRKIIHYIKIESEDKDEDEKEEEDEEDMAHQARMPELRAENQRLRCIN